LYALGILAYNRSTALFAATLVAVSPFMNWYGNEIRMYTLLTLIVIFNQYFYIKLWKTHGESENHAWAGYVVTALLGVYTHYFFIFNLLAQAIFYFTHRSLFHEHAFKRFIVAAVIVVAAFAPWLWFVFAQGQAQNSAPGLTAPTSINLFN